jgi:arylsulfatase A-like enzyme
MSHRITPFLFLALSLSLLLSLSAAATPAPKPNIVYILADDMGYADAGFNGGTDIKTPHLDQLARDGANLKSFYAQPVCSPTRAALLTGRYPSHTGVYGVVRPNAPWGLPLEERTLPQALRSVGYETAIVGKWHLGESAPAYLPTRRGFDHQYGLWFGNIDYFTHLRDGVLDWHRNDEPSHDEGYTTHLIAREAVQRIRAKKSGQPLFLYVAFNAVHDPHQVPDSYLAPYAHLEGVRRTYAGMLAAMDEAVGQILAALDQAGLRENTLVIFSSDNGGASPGKVTSNGPLRAGKGTIYEGGVRVCASARWPGHIAAGSVIHEPLHIVDWFPTLLKLAGAPAAQPLPVDGRDLWPVLTRKARNHLTRRSCFAAPSPASPPSARVIGNCSSVPPAKKTPARSNSTISRRDLGETK